VIKLTFGEALNFVWIIINERKDRDAIKEKLNEYIEGDICKIYVLVYLVNCLNGFDNKNIIRFNDSLEMVNVIEKVRNTYRDVEMRKKIMENELSKLWYNNYVSIENYLIHLE
jgi:hypothetical protein